MGKKSSIFAIAFVFIATILSNVGIVNGSQTVYDSVEYGVEVTLLGADNPGNDREPDIVYIYPLLAIVCVLFYLIIKYKLGRKITINIQMESL